MKIKGAGSYIARVTTVFSLRIYELQSIDQLELAAAPSTILFLMITLDAGLTHVELGIIDKPLVAASVPP